MADYASYNGHRVFTCPNGCDEAELEVGTDLSSFLALCGHPYKYIRCGACGFGEENKDGPLTTEIGEAIAVWNGSCKGAGTHG